jgi:hypothetical protein
MEALIDIRLGWLQKNFDKGTTLIMKTLLVLLLK